MDPRLLTLLLMMLIINIVKKGFFTLYEMVGIYLLWIIIYYAASHLHTYLCTPYGYYGFLMTPFVSQMPQCHAFRWVIYKGGSYINTFWLVISGLLVKKLQI
jgi:hypothetical protein